MMNLKANVSTGPNDISTFIWAIETFPILANMFHILLKWGAHKLADASVVPLLKKDGRHQTSNCRLVLLTFITCQPLEHLVYRKVMQYFEAHNTWVTTFTVSISNVYTRHSFSPNSCSPRRVGRNMANELQPKSGTVTRVVPRCRKVSKPHTVFMATRLSLLMP